MKALAQVFPCEFCEISKNIFLTEHLWATASYFTVSTFNLDRILNEFKWFKSFCDVFRGNNSKWIFLADANL